MLECPNFFLNNSQSLHIGRRFSALSADEELEFGNVYVMFPMRRVSSVVTAADMAVLFMAANSAAKRIAGAKAKVSPEAGRAGQENVLKGTDDPQADGGSRLSLEGDLERFHMLEVKYRSAVCRSKKPLLETIKEEPVCSR